jgi:hypothetical protein
MNRKGMPPKDAWMAATLKNRGLAIGARNKASQGTTGQKLYRNWYMRFPKG